MNATAIAAFKKGDTVFYDNGAGTFRAQVKTAHRDGSMTIVAKCEVRDGKDVPYTRLGFTYRIGADRLRATAAA